MIVMLYAKSKSCIPKNIRSPMAMLRWYGTMFWTYRNVLPSLLPYPN